MHSFSVLFFFFFACFATSFLSSFTFFHSLVFKLSATPPSHHLFLKCSLSLCRYMCMYIRLLRISSLSPLIILFFNQLIAILLIRLCIFLPSVLPCRNLVESVILWTPEDGDHQPRPANPDQRGDNPPLGLGAWAQWGLKAAWCRVDHRVQEHLRLSQVGSALDWITGSN